MPPPRNMNSNNTTAEDIRFKSAWNMLYDTFGGNTTYCFPDGSRLQACCKGNAEPSAG